MRHYHKSTNISFDILVMLIPLLNVFRQNVKMNKRKHFSAEEKAHIIFRLENYEKNSNVATELGILSNNKIICMHIGCY